ncbi:MAG: hypothetical protein ACI906_005167 [Candidatus Latescibacterota bacterium]|jgi:hypothetical protein
MLSDTKFTVNLQAKKTEEGTFRPWASVIHQDGGRFKTMTLELGEEVFMVEGAALQYAKDQTMTLLQRQNAKAEIRFSPMRKAS